MADDRRPPFGIANLSGLLAAMWVILAWINPELTYHLAPPLVAGSFPIGHRLRVSQPLNGVQAFATFVGALLPAIQAGRAAASRQVDFNNAFVQATLQEDVYVSLPAGFEGSNGENSKATSRPLPLIDGS